MKSILRGLIGAVLLLSSAGASAYVSVSIHIGPPPLPYYEQPWLPAAGHIWIPGYWAWDEGYEDFFWVPGTWVLAPARGLYWTPGYWAWHGGLYHWRRGYWGTRVGYYGGINYGYGYPGHGYYGGRWDGDRFWYNTVYNRVNVSQVHYHYHDGGHDRWNRRRHDDNRASYNGGDGGTQARPPRDEDRRDRRSDETELQREHERAARANRNQHHGLNRGRPDVVATTQPAAFNAPGAVRGGWGTREDREARREERAAERVRRTYGSTDESHEISPRPGRDERTGHDRNRRGRDEAVFQPPPQAAPPPRQEPDYTRPGRQRSERDLAEPYGAEQRARQRAEARQQREHRGGGGRERGHGERRPRED